MTGPKKLIEVALPLDDINKACVKEKSIRHGHPSTLHLWWARRPLAAARAVLFAQLVNDPGGERGYKKGMTKEQARLEREKLFDIIRDLVKWENTNNEEVLERARTEIRKSWEETCKEFPEYKLNEFPAFHDPFAGGGSIPLEAQRLGLEAHASDLNPVAVLINKAMIEIPQKFAGRPSVGAAPDRKSTKANAGQNGLAEDILHYGSWMREEAFRRIGHLYPQIELPKEYGGGKANVIAWIWCRTVLSPDPALSTIEVPLVRSFMLSKKRGMWAEPVIHRNGKEYHFEIRQGEKPSLDGTVSRKGGVCLLSKTAIPFKYIRVEGRAGRMSNRLMAIVVEGKGRRIYLPPTKEMENIALIHPSFPLSTLEIPKKDKAFCTPNYGITKYTDLFTSRQLVALTTFSDLVQVTREKVLSDAQASGWEDDGINLEKGGTQATAYADAVATYLALGVSRLANRLSSCCFWDSQGEKIQQVFARQAIPMVWESTEGNPFSNSTGNFLGQLEYLVNALKNFPTSHAGYAYQADALTQKISCEKVLSLDPPYFDNIGYSDLSDFFYIWLRKSLKSLFPKLLATLATPKTEELIASPYRHSSKEMAGRFFLQGMTSVFENLSSSAHPAFPITIYYGFKQSEESKEGHSSRGWATFLEGLLKAGFIITGTWPLRSELVGNLKKEMNALASSIVLVCRKRPEDAPVTSRSEFLNALKAELPEALDDMIGGSKESRAVDGVDFDQAAIGPGMAVFSKYQAVLEADGTSMSVKTALGLINKAIDDYFHEGQEDLDNESRFCLQWFLKCSWEEGLFGEADVLARAKGISVKQLHEEGVLQSEAGKVRLFQPGEYEKSKITSVWSTLHMMIRLLQKNGSEGAASVLASNPKYQDAVRRLAYRMYILCDRKKLAQEARGYNALTTSWQDIVSQMSSTPDLFDEVRL